MKIRDVLNLPDGMPVADLLGRVAKVWGEKAGEGQHGPWRVINFQLKDDTDEVRTSWWNPPDGVTAESIQGQLLRVNAVKSNKGQLVGAAREDNTHDGKTYKNLKLRGDGAGFYDGGQRAQATNSHGSTSTPTTSTSSLPDRLTAEQVYSFMATMIPRFDHLLQDQRAVVAAVNTLVIGVLQGTIAYNPLSLEQGDAPDGPETEQDFDEGEPPYRYGDPEPEDVADDLDVPF